MELIRTSGTVGVYHRGHSGQRGIGKLLLPSDVFLTTTRDGVCGAAMAANAALRALLASGKLGRHNGLPAFVIIVTTTPAELEAAAGRGLTGGGSILPMSDVIRLARHARHYLATFDKGKALAPYHTERLASPGQRIVLYVAGWTAAPRAG
jgi:hypothetical protein